MVEGGVRHHTQNPNNIMFVFSILIPVYVLLNLNDIWLHAQLTFAYNVDQDQSDHLCSPTLIYIARYSYVNK